MDDRLLKTQRYGEVVSYGEEVALDDLDALEQAIVNICDIDMVHAIQDRKKVLQKK